MISDTVTVNLRDTISPFKLVNTYKTILNLSGLKTFSFPNALFGKKYYLRVKYRNSVVTWSTVTATFAGDSLSYNFSTEITQVYGSNMKQAKLSHVVFAIYSGDINQDRTKDASDVSDADNDLYNSLRGYVNTDVTGDNFVDAGDVSIVDNNASMSVSAITP